MNFFKTGNIFPASVVRTCFRVAAPPTTIKGDWFTMSLSRSLFVRRAETVRRFRGLKPGTFQMGAGAKVVADDCTVVTKPSEVDTRQPVTIASSANVEQCEVFVTIMVLSIISSLEASL